MNDDQWCWTIDRNEMKNGININVNYCEVRRMVRCKRRLNSPHASVGISGIANLVEPAKTHTGSVCHSVEKRMQPHPMRIGVASNNEDGIFARMLVSPNGTNRYVRASCHQSHSGRCGHRKSQS
jgi:hypothetical protein